MIQPANATKPDGHSTSLSIHGFHGHNIMPVGMASACAIGEFSRCEWVNVTLPIVSKATNARSSWAFLPLWTLCAAMVMGVTIARLGCAFSSFGGGSNAGTSPSGPSSSAHQSSTHSSGSSSLSASSEMRMSALKILTSEAGEEGFPPSSSSLSSRRSGSSVALSNGSSGAPWP